MEGETGTDSLDPIARLMINRPFDFKRYPSRDFKVPSWFKHYLPHSEESVRHWEHQYQLAKAGEQHEIPEWSMRSPAGELAQLMSAEFWSEVPKDFGSILDVGCNDGYMVKVFQNEGKKAVGINDSLMPIDWVYIEDNNLAVVQGDMHNMDFPNAVFEAVWCRHTLEHSFAPLQVLAEINRVLKFNGYLFAVLPPPPQPPEPFPDHWHQIPEYQFRYLLESCNFEVLKLWTAWFSYKRPNDNLEIRAICRKIGGW
jgi:SAM-dependent methyltransferase